MKIVKIKINNGFNNKINYIKRKYLICKNNQKIKKLKMKN